MRESKELRGLPEFSPASYNGVPFSVPEVSRSTQHGIARNHAPYTSYVKKDDLGLATEVYNVEAFVAGKDAYERADALRTELDKASPGTLILPTMLMSDGNIYLDRQKDKNVYVVSSQECQGYADGLFFVTFSVVFERMDEREKLDSEGATPNIGEKDEYLLTVLAEENSKALIEKVSSSKRLSLDRVRALLNEFKEGLRILYQAMNAPFQMLAELNALEGEFSQLAASSIGQVTAITNMTTNLTQSLAAMPERNHSLIKPQITNAQAALEKLSTIGLKAEPQHHLLQTQFAAQLISGAAVIAPSISYESSQQALSARSEIDRLLSRVRHVVDFSTYQALDELQVAFDLEMQSLIAALPKEKIAPKSDEPLLALMHRLRGRAIGRVPNPFFPQEYEVRYVSQQE